MASSRILRCGLLVIQVAACGCLSTPRANTTIGRLPPTSLPSSQDHRNSGTERSSRSIVLASHEVPDSLTIPGEQPPQFADDFERRSELHSDDLVQEVLQRNPTLQVAWAAWAAAAELAPQASAFDDPMLQSMVAPSSFAGSSNVQSSYYVGIAQKLPWWGKRNLRGQVAQWEANAMALDSQEVELRLVETTRIAFTDYFVVMRELELNREIETVIEEFRNTAQVKYESNQVPQQDVLQAEVELGRLAARRVELEQLRLVTVARINTLLHRSPEMPLPPPPETLASDAVLPAVEELRESAVSRRPELAALDSRIQAEESALALACQEYYPDFELMGRYDRFWFDVEQRAQMGLNVNIPLNRARRDASVREAEFRITKLQAEYQQQVDANRLEIETIVARIVESQRKLALYSDRILPAARANVESANAGYVAGTVDFLRVITAQRELIELREQYLQSIAELHRRVAELHRATGNPGKSTATSIEATAS